MKKGIKILLFSFILIGIVLFVPKKIYAKCIPAALTSTCDESFDCEINWSIVGNNAAWCEVTHPGSCVEVTYDGTTYVTWCFSPKGEPTPTVAPCGTVDNVCCPPPNLCNSGLTPDSAGTPGQCFCREIESDPYPTGGKPIPLTTPDNAKVFCDTQGKPTNDSSSQKIFTAIGCIPIQDLNEFVKWLLSKIIFIASGIAFLLMAFGAIQIITSAGNPDKMKAGNQLITSALSGLIFIILSVFLLKLIGVDILQLPGFGS